jgi:hypothetical protein
VSVVAILVGLSWGMLLVALGFGLWGRLRGTRGLSHSAHVAAWGAAGVLVIGALLGWGSGLPALESLIGAVDRQALEGPVLSLTLMAALATPLRIGAPEEAPRNCALCYLPAWLLTSAALIRTVRPSVAILSGDWVTPVRFSLAVCGGLGARAMGQSLHLLVTGVSYVEWPGTLTYGLTTLLSASVAFVNLWQRGALWAGANPALRGGITGAWLAWSADRLAPRRYPRLRAVLTIVAALLLILAAVGPV